MVSLLPRVAACGRRVTGGKGVTLVRSVEGVARYTGVQTCGSIWACPVCSAKVRQVRADELQAGLSEHIAAGGGAYFVTLTIRHHEHQALAFTLGVVQAAFRRLLQGSHRVLDVGGQVIGVVRSTEITHGANGWHPHIHALILTPAPLDPDAFERFSARLWAGWEDAVKREGGGKCDPHPDAFRLEAACNMEALSRYLTKVRDSESVVSSTDRLGARSAASSLRSISLEMTRSDLKAARRGSRHPFQIAADAATAARVFGELTADADLWREYEAATRGRRAMSWTRGLRAYLAGLAPDAVDLVERSDEDLADDNVAQEGDEVIARIDRDCWSLILARPGLRARLLDLAETGGAAAVALQLNALRFHARAGT